MPQYYQYQKNVPLGPGQVLRHDQNGYFAGPPLSAQAPPPAQTPAGYYAGAITSDPAYIQGTQNIRADVNAQGVNSADAVRRLLIQYGMVPQGFQDPYGWVDEQTKQLAGQNTEAGLSTFARLKRAYEMATKQGSRGLAARNMLPSGAQTQMRGENDLLYRQQQSDAINQMLEQANQSRSGYVDALRQAEIARQGLATDAAGRASQYAMPGAPPRRPPAGIPKPNTVRAGFTPGWRPPGFKAPVPPVRRPAYTAARPGGRRYA